MLFSMWPRNLFNIFFDFDELQQYRYIYKSEYVIRFKKGKTKSFNIFMNLWWWIKWFYKMLERHMLKYSLQYDKLCVCTIELMWDSITSMLKIVYFVSLQVIEWSHPNLTNKNSIFHSLFGFDLKISSKKHGMSTWVQLNMQFFFFILHAFIFHLFIK